MDLPDQVRERAQEEPAVIGMARSAGELTYRLRQRNDELMAYLAEIEDTFRQFEDLKMRLSVDLGVEYKADLPDFLMNALQLYRDATAPQPSMPEGIATRR